MMKRWIVLGLMVVLFPLSFALSLCDARSFSQSFKITVYIPPHVMETPSSLIQQSQNDPQAETTVEDIIRDNHPIRLQTTVLR